MQWIWRSHRGHVARAGVIDQLAAVELAGHGVGSPEGRGVEAGGVELHVGDEDSGAVSGQAAGDQAVG